MTDLRNGRLQDFTFDFLFFILGKLDQHIEIRV